MGGPQRRVAIVGAAGFIGARLNARLLQDVRAWSVLAIDRRRPASASFASLVDERSASDLSDVELASLDAVVYLGGCSGADTSPQCRKKAGVYQSENVEDIVRLAGRMSSRQLLVFASTSALAEGSGARPVAEDEPLATHLFDNLPESMLRREKALRALSEGSVNAPRMIGLRLGTVVGVSPSQRLDALHCSLVCSAFLRGVLHVTHLESYMAVLSIDDLVRALLAVLSSSAPTLTQRRFEVFNVQSFAGSIAAFANEVASQTGAIIDAQDLSPELDIAGLSMDTSKFRSAFGFNFSGSNSAVTRDLVNHAHNVCAGREFLFPSSPPSVPCAACGHAHMVPVLDLGSQPQDINFRSTSEEALVCPRFPVALTRCPACRHMQISQSVESKQLLSPGTKLYENHTLQGQFGWLAAIDGDINLSESSYFGLSLFRAKAENMRSWLNKQLSQFAARGAVIVGYGASTDGVTLLHFLDAENPKYEFEFLVDESLDNRGTFVPGTSVQVQGIDSLRGLPQERLLVLVFFSQTFQDSMMTAKIKGMFDMIPGVRHILGAIPFPNAHVIDLSVNGEPLLLPPLLLRNPLRAREKLVALSLSRRRTVLIMHFFNEAMLLPYFIQHHAPVFDEAVLIDYNSTDSSLDIIRREAPSTWRVVQSRNVKVDLVVMDEEILEIEVKYIGYWRLTLATTEFVVHPLLREHLSRLDGTDNSILRFRSFVMAGSDEFPLTRFTSLIKQRSAFLVDPVQARQHSADGISIYSRFLHHLDAGLPYQPGRHAIDLPDSAWSWTEQGFIAKYTWTPWPESIARKMQIGAKIPQSEYDANRGNHHKYNADFGRLKSKREEVLRASVLHDFSAPKDSSPIERQATTDWYETCNGNVQFH